MECELCGRVCACKPAEIDGVRMMLCPGCMRHGKGVKPIVKTPASINTFPGKISKPKPKDVYKNMNKELISNWNEIIKKARKKKGLSREQLGFKIGERTVTIGKIENGDLRPSDKTVEKLEKELNIKLIEEVESVSNISTTSHSAKFTLGDFIKTDE